MEANDTGARPSSEAHLDEWVAPDIADEQGFLRAGKILEWMDVVGVLAATRHCRRPVVTVSVDGMELANPIRVGERVTLTASVVHTSDRSVGVAIEMHHGRTYAESATRPCVDAFMTFVALDEEGRPARVPRFVPETPAEIGRFREGELRREFRRKLAQGGGVLAPVEANVPNTPDVRLLVSEWLKVLPRLRMPWDRVSTTRSRGISYIHKIEPIRVGKLNFHGTLYGGTLMRWIEGAAALSARAYVGGAPVRLESLHGLSFLRPAPRDLFVHIRAVAVHAAESAVTVLVNVRAEDPMAGQSVEILRAFLTYVPLDAGVRVPQLECAGDEDAALYEEVEQRRALQRRLRVSA